MWGKNVDIVWGWAEIYIVNLNIKCLLSLSTLFVYFQGVMEAIRISCAGYPTRKPFDEFVDRFGLLAPDVLNGRYNQYFFGS